MIEAVKRLTGIYEVEALRAINLRVSIVNTLYIRRSAGALEGRRAPRLLR